MAELADAQDLKSCGGKTPYRFDSDSRHQKTKVAEPSDAGWSSPVARRAHNPKVIGSNPIPATIKIIRKELADFIINFFVSYLLIVRRRSSVG